ncbi:hypothetical protein OKW76_00350 [Sphingomonas sp. S1-29]|uniref:hypothetical protein n=1 Tax=Sphingomonas sp. S1-29 TaxID=2991074 RepID=UPI002240D1E0|nr:hypothetical protein [Sphingomonas sp. S1-29]UZK69575.1 hypothetical protein OKW76_00350 [Sphingomonas sp. S1-29]
MNKLKSVLVVAKAEDYMTSPKHPAGEDHCCSHFEHISSEGVVYAFATMDEAVAWKMACHMETRIVQDFRIAHLISKLAEVEMERHFLTMDIRLWVGHRFPDWQQQPLTV